MRAALIITCLTLSGCGPFPELDGVVTPDTQDAAFPALVPIEPLLAAAQPVTGDPTQTVETLEARVAALRARARALQRRTIVDGATRARFQRGIG